MQRRHQRMQKTSSIRWCSVIASVDEEQESRPGGPTGGKRRTLDPSTIEPGQSCRQEN